jgi:hypothetical protein
VKKCFKKYGSQLELIFHIYDPDHETGVIPLNANLKKQKSKIFNQTNIDG